MVSGCVVSTVEVPTLATKSSTPRPNFAYPAHLQKSCSRSRKDVCPTKVKVSVAGSAREVTVSPRQQASCSWGESDRRSRSVNIDIAPRSDRLVLLSLAGNCARTQTRCDDRQM